MLLQFSIVISTSMPTNEAVQLDHFLFENNIPFVYARIYGMLGFLRLSLREHIIWNNHSENDPYDLRLV
jgi:amyloid beta precursor protein binding protein 1